jgi:hypothetical protein
LVVSSWWPDAKQVIIQNLAQALLAKFRQLAKSRATFVWQFAWRLGVLQWFRLLRAAGLNAEPLRSPAIAP